MQQGDSLREQSLQMLKDQAGQLRAFSREVQLKQDQVRFMKETVLALEQEKDAVLHQNYQLRHKLKTMANQITQYNANVVQKIYGENQQLVGEVEALREQLERTQVEGQEMSRKLGQIEGRLQSESSEKVQVATAFESLKQIKSKYEKRVALLQKQNRELQVKNISLQRQLDESSSQVNYCSQQIDVLTQKHHESLKTAEKRLKQTVEKMVAREELERSEKEVKDAGVRNKQLRFQLDRAVKDIQKGKFQLAAVKDKLLGYEVKEETRSLQLRTDFANLGQSVKLGKKIAQFQSEEHQTASEIYQEYKQCLTKRQQIQSSLMNAKNQLRQAELQAETAHQTTKLIEIELSTFREHNKETQHSLEAEYENKIMQISLRLKREEIALSGIRMRENELQNLREELEAESQQHHMQKETMLRTMDQIKKQNNKLSEELASAIRMCEENLWSRECVSHYKLVLQNMVTVVFYMHLLLVRFRERTRKLYAPFIQYYFVVHQVIAPATPRESIRRRFKAGVYVLIALRRMRKETGGGRGLEWYACAAVERRQKIQNLSSHLEHISSIVLKGGKVAEVLKMSQQVYKWKVANVLRVNLPMGDDRHQLKSAGFQQSS